MLPTATIALRVSPLASLGTFPRSLLVTADTLPEHLALLPWQGPSGPTGAITQQRLSCPTLRGSGCLWVKRPWRAGSARRYTQVL